MTQKTSTNEANRIKKQMSREAEKAIRDYLSANDGCDDAQRPPGVHKRTSDDDDESFSTDKKKKKLDLDNLSHSRLCSLRQNLTLAVTRAINDTLESFYGGGVASGEKHEATLAIVATNGNVSPPRDVEAKKEATDPAAVASNEKLATAILKNNNHFVQQKHQQQQQQQNQPPKKVQYHKSKRDSLLLFLNEPLNVKMSKTQCFDNNGLFLLTILKYQLIKFKKTITKRQDSHTRKVESSIVQVGLQRLSLTPAAAAAAS